MYDSPLQNAAEFWHDEQQFPRIPFGSPLDDLLEGGISRGLIHGVIMPKAIMAPAYHQLLLNYAITVPREEWRPIMLIEGINRFNPYLLSKMAVKHRIHPTSLLDLIQVARAFQYNQMIELVEEKLGEWIEQNESPGMIVIAGLNVDFEEMITKDYLKFDIRKNPNKGELNLRPFDKLTRALGSFSKAIKSRPYIVLYLAPHSHSLRKAAGGTFLHHYCNIITQVEPMERKWEYSLHQHPFLPERSFPIWTRPPVTNLRELSKTKILDNFL